MINPNIPKSPAKWRIIFRFPTFLIIFKLIAKNSAAISSKKIRLKQLKTKACWKVIICLPISLLFFNLFEKRVRLIGNCQKFIKNLPYWNILQLNWKSKVSKNHNFRHIRCGLKFLP